MSRDPDWTDLAGAWTANGDDGAAASWPQLARRLRWRAVGGRINFIAECLLCLVASALAIWLILSGDPARLIIGSATLLFAGFGLAMTVWARGRAAPVLTGTPADALRTALHQAESGLRWARAGLWMSLGGCAFLGVNLALDLMTGGPQPMTLQVIGGGAAAMAVCALLYRRHGQRCRRRIASHRAALDELET